MRSAGCVRFDGMPVRQQPQTPATTRTCLARRNLERDRIQGRALHYGVVLVNVDAVLARIRQVLKAEAKEDA